MNKKNKVQKLGCFNIKNNLFLNFTKKREPINFIMKKSLIILFFILICNLKLFSQSQNKPDSINPTKQNLKFETQYFEDSSNGKVISNKIQLYTINHKEILDTFKIDTLLFKNGVIHSISNQRYIKGKLNYDGLYRSYYPNGQKRLIVEMSINEIAAQKSYGYDGKDTAEVEFMNKPIFVGGSQALQNFLAENLVYPRKAYENEIQGVVIVTFIIKKDGSVTDVDVLKSVNLDLEKAAMDLIKLTNGKWIPGVQFGEIVNVKAIIPITFSLD
jgi:TonB family protein